MTITNEDLSENIKRTEMELSAYQWISRGLTVLMGLPKNIETGRALYYKVKLNEFSQLEKDCAKLLKNLYDEKEKN